MKKLYKKIVSLVMSALLAVMVLPVTTHASNQQLLSGGEKKKDFLAGLLTGNTDWVVKSNGKSGDTIFE